jgi:hypothetical protein
LCFFFYKIGEQEAGGVCVVGTSGREEVAKKGIEGEYGVNNVYTCM